MRKIFLAVVLVSFGLQGYVQAAGDMKQNVGCGLGEVALEGADETLMVQVLAATTNGTFGNQTFGITSGTSNCKQPTRVVSSERLNEFVAGNMDTLAKDMARGQGEALSTLAELMAVSHENRAEFYATLQANFSKVFTSESVESADVIDNIAAVYSAAG
ncbi:MAG: DUF3015 family protein [Deltaproteobacteria bacterium]|nr:DUF3015 family protein [Deltaproteobacteria bacterium]